MKSVTFNLKIVRTEGVAFQKNSCIRFIRNQFIVKYSHENTNYTYRKTLV